MHTVLLHLPAQVSDLSTAAHRRDPTSGSKRGGTRVSSVTCRASGSKNPNAKRPPQARATAQPSPRTRPADQQDGKVSAKRLSVSRLDRVLNYEMAN